MKTVVAPLVITVEVAALATNTFARAPMHDPRRAASTERGEDELSFIASSLVGRYGRRRRDR